MKTCVGEAEKHNDRGSVFLVLGDRVKILLADL